MRRAISYCTLIALALSASRPARAHEVFLGVGPAAGFSSGNGWEGDGAIPYV